LVEEFSAIRKLLEALDYVEDWSLTARGQRLRRIYNELDLLLAESIEKGVLFGLEPEELAALLSVFVYEPRTDQISPAEWPTPELHTRWAEIESIWKQLNKREKELRLTPTRRPDPGFGILAYRWASEVAFDDLPTHGMAPGDFVRVSRQLADLLRQVREGVSELRDDTVAALVTVDRGVVAAQGVG
jgi:ATP-dependent RNA helicase HelY